MYQRQIEVVLLSVALGPFAGSFLVLQVMPGMAAVVVLQPPSCNVGLSFELGPLWRGVLVVGTALSQERSFLLPSGSFRHGRQG